MRKQDSNEGGSSQSANPYVRRAEDPELEKLKLALLEPAVLSMQALIQICK